MSADERYAKCKTLEELDDLYNREKRGADTWEYLAAIEKAYVKHHDRLKKEQIK